jgi:hypothetical protein
MPVIVAETEGGGVNEIEVSLDELSKCFFGFGGYKVGQQLFALLHV